MWAAIKASSEVVEILLEEGANPNAEDNDGWTALDYTNIGWSEAKTKEKASEYKRIVEMLQEAGAK